jgi:outer membrane receptor protein involved in Fe transport
MMLARVAGLAIACALGTSLPHDVASAQEPPPAADVSAATVSGTATDANGATLANVTIQLQGPTTLTATTDRAGHYRFTGVRPGGYSVAATRGGYDPAHETFFVVAGTLQNLNVTLAAETLSTLHVIGQTTTNTGGSHFNATAAAVADIPQSTFLDQGQQQVSRILDETPGIVSDRASAAFPGSSGASPVALVNPSIRGGLPWETATLVDGHPVAVQGTGYYWLQSLNANALGSVEVDKGPGTAGIIDNGAINGEVNFRTLDPTAKPTGMITYGTDNYGGQFSTFLSRGTTSNGRLGWVAEYDVDGSPGPLRNYQAPFSTGIATNPAGQTINGYPVGANPYGAAPPPAGIQNSYIGSKTSLVVCCEPINSTYTSKTELLKLVDNLSSASVLTATYLGNQLYTDRDGYGTELLPTTFAPGAGYTGSLQPGPMTVTTGSYFPPGEYLNNDEPMFDVEFRTSPTKNDTALARFYSDSVNTQLGNAETAANQVYTATFQSVSGTMTTTKCPSGQATCTVAFNGGPATIVMPGQYNSTPAVDHLGGASFEYDHVTGPNVYSVAYDDSISAANWIKTTAIYQGTGWTTAAPVPNYTVGPGANEREGTALLRAVLNFPHGFSATLSDYLNSYENTFYANQPATGAPNGMMTSVFSHNDPRLGLSWRVNDDVSLRAAAGSSTAPPFLELYQPTTVPAAAGSGVLYFGNATTAYSQYVNNPNLRPETAFGYDIGGDFRLARDPATVISTDAYETTLWNQFFEGIGESGTTYTSGGKTGELYYMEYQNLSQARYQGVELSIRRDPRLGWGFVAQGSLQKAFPYNLPPDFYGTVDGQRIANLGIVSGSNYVASNGNGESNGFNASALNTSTVSIPYAEGYAEVSYRFKHDGRASLGTTYVGKNNSYGLPPFLVSNASLRYGIGRNSAALFTVYNLFDVHNNDLVIANGGIAVPLANGNFGLENANGVGPATFNFSVTHTFGY